MSKLSIIIPIYNVKNYLRRTIESVINQTETDIEIILVDDGSTDGSEHICDEYKCKDDRITVIHKINGGLSSARNTGIDIAKSEYIMLLDGDDYLSCNAAETLLNFLRLYPSDIIQFHYQEVDDNNTQIDAKVFFEDKVFQARTTREYFEKLYYYGGEAASACTKLIKKEIFKNIRYKNMQHEDEMWCTEAFNLPLVITYIPNVLYYYMFRENSIINTNFNIRKLDIFNVINSRIKTLEDNKLFDLLHFEYERLYNAIINLASSAYITRNYSSFAEIKRIFAKNKKSIIRYALLNRKQKIFFYLMCINFNIIKVYTLYRK